jgi:hypothetical protein
MKLTIKNFVLTVLMTGTLLIPAASAIADSWHWSREHNRWDRHADVRSDRRDLEEARRQLDYDNSHHASRKKLAEDNARIQDLERDFHVDRRARRR